MIKFLVSCFIAFFGLIMSFVFPIPLVMPIAIIWLIIKVWK